MVDPLSHRLSQISDLIRELCDIRLVELVDAKEFTLFIPEHPLGPLVAFREAALQAGLSL